MKKIFMTMPCLALALTGFSANAADIKPFVGGNLAINGVSYSDDLDDLCDELGIELPESFMGLGLEAGIKFAADRIYNAALTFSYDYVFDETIESDESYWYRPEIGFSSISVTYDNYLRVSGNAEYRQDIVLGGGLANATERVAGEKSDEIRIVFKIGYNRQISEFADLYFNGRCFIPTDSDSEVDAFFNANMGVRFVF